MRLIFSILFVMFLSCGPLTEAAPELPSAPGMLAAGPPPEITKINLKAEEITGLVLLESVADIASSASLAGGCRLLEGSYSIEITADGAVNKPEGNVAKISSPGNPQPLILNGTAEAPDSFRGQIIHIHQAKKNKLKEKVISDYSGAATVNRELTLLTLQSETKAAGQNGSSRPYQSFLIKNFYEAQKSDGSNYLLAWGLASSSRENFPVNKFWAQFKALKANGQLKRVLLQKDLLVGASACRILLDAAVDSAGNKEKNKDKDPEGSRPANLTLKGVMAISKSQPREEIPEATKF